MVTVKALHDRVNTQDNRRTEIRKRLRELADEGRARKNDWSPECAALEVTALAAELASLDADLLAWASYTEAG